MLVALLPFVICTILFSLQGIFFGRWIPLAVYTGFNLVLYIIRKNSQRYP